MGKIKQKARAGYENIRLSFLNKNIILNTLSIPVICYTAYLLSGIISHTFLDLNIPNEYREAANVYLTRELMLGKNPYSLSALKDLHPCLIYLYGPLYSMAVAFFGIFIHLDIIALHYLVTFACIIISAFLSAWMVHEKSSTLLAPSLAFVFLINCHWRYNYLNAVPDSMGLMLMVLIFFVLTRPGLKHKPFIAALLTMAAFLTKQYFLLTAGTATAFLFISEGGKKSLKYLMHLAILTFLLFVVIGWQFPLFWTYTLYFAKGPGKGISNHVTRNGVKITGNMYNLSQVMSLGGMFLMLFVTEAIGILSIIKEFFTHLKNTGSFQSKIFTFIKKTDSTIVLTIIHLAVAAICLSYLGKNDGAWLSYYLELFMPALVIGSLIFLEAFLHKLPPITNEDPKARYFHILYHAFYLLLIVFTLYRTGTRLPASPLTEADRTAWQKAEELLDKESGDMYLYPPLAYYGLERGIYVYNSGQPFVITDKFYKRHLKSEKNQQLYPYAGEIFRKHLSYRNTVRSRVRHGDYSVVTFIEDTDEVFTRKDLRAYYRLAATLPLRCGRWSWDVEFWLKKE